MLGRLLFLISIAALLSLASSAQDTEQGSGALTATGVAEHSQHLLGKAIDVRLTGHSTHRLGEYARSLARGGVGFYARSDFIHIDTGPVRFW
jgi:uncharacterized protein YcbK (DUF882 family)